MKMKIAVLMALVFMSLITTAVPITANGSSYSIDVPDKVYVGENFVVVWSTKGEDHGGSIFQIHDDIEINIENVLKKDSGSFQHSVSDDGLYCYEIRYWHGYGYGGHWHTEDTDYMAAIADVSSYEELIEELEAQIAGFEENVNNLENVIADLEATIADLKLQIKGFENQIDNLKAAVDELEDLFELCGLDKLELIEMIQSLEAQLSNCQYQLLLAQSQLEEAQSELGELRRLRTVDSNIITGLRADIEELEKDRDYWKNLPRGGGRVVETNPLSKAQTQKVIFTGAIGILGVAIMLCVKSLKPKTISKSTEDE